MRDLAMQQVPTEPVPGGQPGPEPEPPVPVTDPTEPPPPTGEPEGGDPTAPPDAPMIARQAKVVTAGTRIARPRSSFTKRVVQPWLQSVRHMLEGKMADRKMNQASQDFASDLAALREDISKLTGSVSDLLRHRASDAGDQAYNIFGQARDRASKQASRARDEFSSRASDARDEFSSRASDLRDRLADQASDAQDRFGSFSSDIETKIERNPLTAVIVAAIAGLLMGLLSRSF